MGESDKFMSFLEERSREEFDIPMPCGQKFFCPRLPDGLLIGFRPNPFFINIELDIVMFFVHNALEDGVFCT